MASAGANAGHTGGKMNGLIGNWLVDRATWHSDHVGGVQFGLTDGSVRFVTDSIDRATLDALATRAGGEVVGDY